MPTPVEAKLLICDATETELPFPVNGPEARAVTRCPGDRRGPGRPPVTIELDRVRELSALGLSIHQIAHRLGVGERTLYGRFVRDESVRCAFEVGRAEATEIVARRLQQMGLEENNVAALIFFLKTKGGFIAQKETAVTINAPESQDVVGIDVSRIREMAARQRALRDEMLSLGGE